MPRENGPALLLIENKKHRRKKIAIDDMYCRNQLMVDRNTYP